VAVLRADARTDDASPTLRSRTDDIVAAADAARICITDADLRSQLRTEVIDAVADFRRSPEYLASLAASSAVAARGR